MSENQEKKLEGNSRERLIQAAIRHFAMHGFGGASTREIAHEAGENLGQIGYYFKTKEHLWQAAVDRLLSENMLQLQQWVAGVPDGDTRAKARHVLMQYVRFVGRHPELMRIMAHEAGQKSSRVDWLVQQHLKPNYEFTKQVINDFIEGGVFPQASPANIFYLIIGAAGTVFSAAPGLKEQTGEDPADDDFIEAHARLVADWLIGK